MQNPSMLDIKWRTYGALFLGFAFFVALPMMYFVPLFGMPFFFVFPDAVLLGLAALLAWIVPGFSPAWRLLFFFFTWLTLSLAMEIPQLVDRLSPSMRRANEGIRVIVPLPPMMPPAVLNISGPANLILTARGRRWEITPDGLTKSGGRSLANMVTSFDLADALQQRGIAPQMNGEGFPRLVVRREYNYDATSLSVDYLDKDRRTIASYKRQLPMAPVYPGHVLKPEAKLAASVFYFNFWRAVLGINRPVDIDKEMNQFLGTLFGGGNPATAIADTPMRTLAVARDMVNKVPAGSTVTQFFANLDGTAQHTSTGKSRQEVCGLPVFNMEFGEPGDSLYVSGFARSRIQATLIHRITPDEHVFSLYCDKPRQRIIAFYKFGTAKKPGLRLSIFDLNGQLQNVSFFRPPQYIGSRTTVLPGSVTVDNAGNIRFTMLQKIWSVSEQHLQIDNQSEYRSWVLHAEANPL